MKFTVVYRSTEGLKTMAARGLVNGRGPLRRSGRDSVFHTLALGIYINYSFAITSSISEDLIGSL